MKNPKQQAKRLWNEIEQWTPDAYWRAPTDVPGITTKGLAEALVVRNGKPWVRLGFAVRERLIASAKLNELLGTVEQFWPELRSWAQRERQKLELVMDNTRIPGLPLNSNERWEVMLDMVQAIEGGAQEAIDEPLSIDTDSTEEWVARFAEYRETRALEELFRRRGATFHSSVRAATENIALDESIAPQSDGRAVVQWAMTNYLPAEWLFSWVPDDRKIPRHELYRPLFEMRRGPMDMTQLDNLFRSIAGMIDIEPEEAKNARSIVRRLSEAIAELGYDNVIDAVTSNGGQSGQHSMLGNTAPINLIPGASGGACCPIVLAMANGSYVRKKTGFPRIMRSLRAHLIRCAQHSKLAIVVTDVWDPKLIEESRQDFLAHQENGLQLVVLLAAGNTLTHLPINLK